MPTTSYAFENILDEFLKVLERQQLEQILSICTDKL